MNRPRKRVREKEASPRKNEEAPIAAEVGASEGADLEETLWQLQSAINSSLNGIAMCDKKGTFIYVNQAFVTLWGFDEASQILGRSAISFLGSPGEITQVISQVLEHGNWSGEMSGRRRDGTHFDAQVYANSFMDRSGRLAGIRASFSDLTVRKQMETALKESEKRYRELFQNMNSGVVVYEAVNNGDDFLIRDVNNAVESIENVERQKIIGKPLTEVFPGVKQFGLLEVLQRVWRTGVSEQFAAAFYEDEQHHGWRENRIYKIPPDQIVAVYDDITERKKAEEDRERLQAQLLQAQKMESIGRLAGGVAHDFNNMLMVIIGYAEMALEQVDPADSFHALLEEIRTAALRSADITRQLLAFARKQTRSLMPLDLNETIEGILKMLRRLIGEDIEIAWLPGRNLWPVYMDPAQINQILANLCVNSRDAISGGGKIVIETSRETLDEIYCAANRGFRPGEYVTFVVSDNGCGMDRKTLDSIFEPFFTTKGVDKGTGLGMATVYGIVKQNNGFINVYSEPGVGTSVRIYLPRHEGEVAAMTENAVQDIPAGAGETILLVEDEVAILKMGRRILERLGYQVLTAGTPGKALDLARNYEGRIHLLLTDMIMPEMNGKDLAERVLAVHPDASVLYMSGYTAENVVHQGILEDGMDFIPKPFSLEILAAKVREILNRQQHG